MKLKGMARTAWGNLLRGVLLAFTLELPWPQGMHWLWSAVDWGSGFLVAGSAGTLGVWGLLNAWWLCERALTDDPPYEPQRPLAAERMAVGVSQDGEVVFMPAWSPAGMTYGTQLMTRTVTIEPAMGSLRYIGPPRLYRFSHETHRPGKSLAPAGGLIHVGLCIGCGTAWAACSWSEPGHEHLCDECACRD